MFEVLHPETRVITNYGAREDLVLLACFDRADFRYRTYAELVQLASVHGLTHVDEFAPPGNTLGEQIEGLLTSIAGTDQEGTVITIEQEQKIVYRVKVKSPDYLRVLKLVVTCTYARVVEMLDSHPEWRGWADMESHLRALGREQVPEEVLSFYREHYDAFAAYLADCETGCVFGRRKSRPAFDLKRKPRPGPFRGGNPPRVPKSPLLLTTGSCGSASRRER